MTMYNEVRHVKPATAAKFICAAMRCHPMLFTYISSTGTRTEVMYEEKQIELSYYPFHAH